MHADNLCRRRDIVSVCLSVGVSSGTRRRLHLGQSYSFDVHDYHYMHFDSLYTILLGVSEFKRSL
jgi:hypothetical protein